MSDHAAALQAYYALDKERDRLGSAVGRVEFERTVEVVRRTLPSPPARVADIGGGPGRYTDWLIADGYTVVHRDLVQHHVDQVGTRHPGIDARVCDARALDLADSSVDVVLLLGPLYHLLEADDRCQALREAARVVRPGGTVHAAAISRWAVRLDGILVARLHEVYPVMATWVADVERTGVMEPIFEGSFCGYTHRPDELRAEIEASGLTLESLVSLEGIAFALGDLEQRLTDDRERQLLFHTLRTLESVPDLLGVGPHMLASGRRPPER